VADVPRLTGDPGAFLGRLLRAAPDAAIVVLTASLSERERIELIRAGACALLLKEIDSGVLTRTIEAVAARRAAGERRADA
jgi:DNA-binding NarL/FixJ family response regulator